MICITCREQQQFDRMLMRWRMRQFLFELCSGSPRLPCFLFLRSNWPSRCLERTQPRREGRHRLASHTLAFISNLFSFIFCISPQIFFGFAKHEYPNCLLEVVPHQMHQQCLRLMKLGRCLIDRLFSRLEQASRTFIGFS